MTKFPATVTPSTTLGAAARLLVSADCGALPVIGELDEAPIGVITDRDMVVRGLALGGGADLLVRDCMTTPVYTVSEDTDLDDCIDLLEEKQIRRAVVIDDHGRVAGIVAQADIASHTSKRKSGELLKYVSAPSLVSTAAAIPPRS